MRKRIVKLVKKHVSIPVLARYSAQGILAYLFNILVTAALTELLHINYLISFIIAFTLTTTFNFFAAVKYIFRVKEDLGKKLFFYLLSVLIFYFINISMVRMLVEVLGWHYIIAVTVTIGFLFIIKFLIYDRYVFKDEKR